MLCKLLPAPGGRAPIPRNLADDDTHRVERTDFEQKKGSLEYWGRKFAKPLTQLGEGHQVLGRYLATKSVDPLVLLQRLPRAGVDEILDAMNHPSRGSNGPGGASGRLFKVMQQYAIPMLLSVMLFLFAGVAVPSWFLLARLACIDKQNPLFDPIWGHYLFHSATRPISITMHSYRMVQTAVTRAIALPVRDFTHPCQAGFTRGLCDNVVITDGELT